MTYVGRLEAQVERLEAQLELERAKADPCRWERASFQHDGSNCRAWNNPREKWCKRCIRIGDAEEALARVTEGAPS